MTVDIGALRKFQETFGSAIEAIPAVIEAAERQADMQREVEAHKAKMQKAKDEIQNVYDKADERLKQFNADISRLQAQKDALTQEIRAERAAADASAAQAQAEAKEKLAQIQAETKRATDQLAGIRAAVAAQTAVAQAEHDASVQVMKNEIADLERRRSLAEQALDSLRAKLG